MNKELKTAVLDAVCLLWDRYNGVPSGIGRIIAETKLHEGQCKMFVEELVEEGYVSRVVTVDVNNHKRFCYRPVLKECKKVVNQ